MFTRSITDHLRILLTGAYIASMVICAVVFYLVHQADKLSSWKKCIRLQSMLLQDLEDFVNQGKQSLEVDLKKILDEQKQSTWNQTIKELIKNRCDPKFWETHKELELVRIGGNNKKHRSIQLNNTFLTRLFITKYIKSYMPGISFELRFLKDNSGFIHGSSEKLQNMDWSFIRVYSLASEKFIKSSAIPSQIRQILGQNKNFDRQPIFLETRTIKNESSIIYWVSSYYSEILGGSRISFVEKRSSYMKTFLQIWQWPLLFFFLTLFVFLRIKRNFLDKLQSSLNECLSYLVYEKRNELDHSIIAEDEISRLQLRMSSFDRRIKEKWMLIKLSLGLQTILNKSGKSLDYYLEEADYFLRDLDERFRVYYLDTTPVEKINRVIEIPINVQQQEFLIERLNRKPKLYLFFPKLRQLDADIISIIQKQFFQMVEKARLEAERSKTEALNSDIQLASRIQNVLMPQDYLDCGDNWDYAFSSEASRGITGEFLDIIKINDSLRFYLVDLYDSGIKASVMSMIYKSYLDFMMADKDSPEKVLEDLQRFLSDKSYDDALANMFIGFIDISSGRLDYVCAGVEMGFHIYDDKYERLTSKFPPVGYELNTTIESDSIFLEKGQILYIVSAESEIQNVANRSSIHSSEIMEIIQSNSESSLGNIISQIDHRVEEVTRLSEGKTHYTQLVFRRC